MPPTILLAAESLQRSASGIARVARLMARVLAEEQRAGRVVARAIVLNDGAAASDLGLGVRTCRGSRLRFVRDVHRAAFSCDAMLYDFAGMARAHPRFGPLRRPHLVWLHGIDGWEGARPAHLARLHAADVLLVPSSYSRERAMRAHPALGRARVCALGTEEETPAAAPAWASTPTCLVLSRLDADGGYKGHRELIDSWPEVVRAVPDAELLIAGDGPGRGLIERWVAASAARERIRVLGFVPEPELPQLWARTWVLAMPSRGEGFGVAYIEAMRHGIPVLASVHDAGAEVNLDGCTGVNVDLDRSGSLAAGLLELLAQPARARAAGEAGRQRWTELYTYAAFRARFAEELRALLACCPRASAYP